MSASDGTRLGLRGFTRVNLRIWFCAGSRRRVRLTRADGTCRYMTDGRRERGGGGDPFGQRDFGRGVANPASPGRSSRSSGRASGGGIHARNAGLAGALIGAEERELQYFPAGSYFGAGMGIGPLGGW